MALPTLRLGPQSQIALVALVSLPIIWLFLQVEPGVEQHPRFPGIFSFYWFGFVIGLTLLGGVHGAPRWGIEGAAVLGVLGQNRAIWYAGRLLRTLWLRRKGAI
jgi:hypothetical protein